MSEKRFAASRKKLKKAREDGQNPKSPLFTQSIVVISLLISIYYGLGEIWIDFKMVLEYALLGGYSHIKEALGFAFSVGVKGVGSCLVLAAVLATISDGVQIGGISFESKPLAAQLSRVSLANGSKKIFGGIKQNLIKLFIVFCVLAFLFFGIRELILRIPLILTLSQQDKLLFFDAVIRKIFFLSASILLVCAGLEVFLNRKKFKKETMMSLEELKDENKESEGDPQMKAARMAAHQALLREEIIARVRRSKVIVVEDCSKREKI